MLAARKDTDVQVPVPERGGPGAAPSHARNRGAKGSPCACVRGVKGRLSWINGCVEAAAQPCCSAISQVSQPISAYYETSMDRDGRLVYVGGEMGDVWCWYSEDRDAFLFEADPDDIGSTSCRALVKTDALSLAGVESDAAFFTVRWIVRTPASRHSSRSQLFPLRDISPVLLLQLIDGRYPCARGRCTRVGRLHFRVLHLCHPLRHDRFTKEFVEALLAGSPSLCHHPPACPSVDIPPTLRSENFEECAGASIEKSPPSKTSDAS